MPASDRRQALGCGCSSVVEHDLAKVGVEGSSPFARSRISLRWQSLTKARCVSGLFVFGDGDHRRFPPSRQNALRKRGRPVRRQAARDDADIARSRGRAATDATNVRYRTAARPNAKIVSNETGLKKFLLNLFRPDRAAWRALLTASGCDNIFGSDPPSLETTKVCFSKRSK